MVQFDASASYDLDGTIVSYDWTFGDGGTGAGATPTHQYSAEDNYQVTLTVTDDDGLTDNLTKTIMVTQESGPALGDVNNNGVIDIIDALQVARYDAGLGPDPFYPEAANADCNGVINIIDALQIARYDAGLISSFECG